MRMLSAFKPPKPRDLTKPVLIVSTHEDLETHAHLSQVNFIYARDVDTALFTLVSGEMGPHISGWIDIKKHASYMDALAYGTEVAKALQYKELAETKGTDLYNVLYGRFCPKEMRV